MKQQAWRRTISSYPWQGQQQPRFADLDLWQHLNNAALIGMQAETVQTWLRGVFGDTAWRQARPLLASRQQATDFLAEAHYPAPLASGCRLLDVGSGGATLACALFQHGQCVGLHQSTLAAWVDGRPQPLPAEVDQALRSAAAAQPPLADPAADDNKPPATTDTAPPVLADFPWRLDLAARFGDNDAHAHASDSSLARYVEQSRVEFLTQTLGAPRLESRTGFMVAHVAVARLLRQRAPVAWQLGCGITRLGERSLTLRSALFDGDHCHAIGDSVMVAIDRDSHRSTALPASAQAALAGFVLGGGTAG